MVDYIKLSSKQNVPLTVGIVGVIVLLTVVFLISANTSGNLISCSTNAECTSDKACMNRTCEDPCKNCGAHTSCQAKNHLAFCSCVPGFEGNSLVGCTPGPNTHIALSGCTSDNQCPQDHRCINQKCQDTCAGVCGVNAICNIFRHRPACACKSGYSGDPFQSCQLDLPQCSTSEQCPQDRSCIRNECRDLCVELCGANTECIIHNHHPACSCKPGYTGSPFQGCQSQTIPVSTVNTDIPQTTFRPTTPSATEKTYHVFTQEKLNWFNALGRCFSEGMRLATIDNEEQYNTLVSVIKLDSPLIHSEEELGKINYWLSGSDLGESGSYTWASTGYEMTFTIWYTGEPKHVEGEEEHCVELRADHSFMMNDQACADLNYYVCENLD